MSQNRLPLLALTSLAALTLSSPPRVTQGRASGLWRRFLDGLLRALGAWTI